MHIVLGLIGVVAAFFLIVYRETVGDMVGEAQWMQKVGGVYNVVIIVAIFIFFWSLAEMTGTTGVLFRPLRNILPGMQQQEQEVGIPAGEFN